MPLKPGRTVELLQSIEKDGFYENYLRGLLSDSARYIFGIQRSFAWQREINATADLLYYAITTLGGLQTLGEEYTSLIQINHAKRQIPTYRQRLLMVLLKTLLPFAIEKILSVIETRVKHMDNSYLGSNRKSYIEKSISNLRAIILLFHRLHLSVFYIDNVYAQISKRVADVEYVTRSQSDASTFTDSFRNLGYLSLFQTLIALGIQLYSLQKTYSAYMSDRVHDNEILDSTESENSKQKCSLCLEKRKNTTTTLCGHLFCWYCIHDCITVKNECPICRDIVKPNQLICLQNFD